MAETNCCYSFGGLITISADGFNLSPTDADITVEPTNIEVKAEANQDGTMCRTAKPKLYKIEVKFREPCGIVWNDFMRKCSLDVTMSENDNNRTHIMTGAAFTGTVKVNRSNGEVDGITIEGPRYQKL